MLIDRGEIKADTERPPKSAAEAHAEAARSKTAFHKLTHARGRRRLDRQASPAQACASARQCAMRAVYVRELAAYFLTPLAYVFIAIFLIALGSFTFEIGRFFDTNQADLAPFFLFHPWLYLVFLPAIAMRLWADEARGGTLELLLSLPAPTWSLVLGKFLAAWTVAAAALLFTTPIWMSVNWLGAPDNAAIFLTYVISFLMAGGYLAIACALSAARANQVIAFVLSVAVGFLCSPPQDCLSWHRAFISVRPWA
jgi:ABC-type transport system involved in cytochrome c biogenesis permease component